MASVTNGIYLGATTKTAEPIRLMPKQPEEHPPPSMAKAESVVRVVSKVPQQPKHPPPSLSAPPKARPLNKAAAPQTAIGARVIPKPPQNKNAAPATPKPLVVPKPDKAAAPAMHKPVVVPKPVKAAAPAMHKPIVVPPRKAIVVAPPCKNPLPPVPPPPPMSEHPMMLPNYPRLSLPQQDFIMGNGPPPPMSPPLPAAPPIPSEILGYQRYHYYGVSEWVNIFLEIL